MGSSGSSSGLKFSVQSTEKELMHRDSEVCPVEKIEKLAPELETVTIAEPE